MLEYFWNFYSFYPYYKVLWSSVFLFGRSPESIIDFYLFIVMVYVNGPSHLSVDNYKPLSFSPTRDRR